MRMNTQHPDRPTCSRQLPPWNRSHARSGCTGADRGRRRRRAGARRLRRRLADRRRHRDPGRLRLRAARPRPTTVNVLAYNSSAVDPFTNTMVKSCTHDNVTVKHDPIDFAGQVQKTTATLAGDKGTYDIIETYGFVIAAPRPPTASSRPLDDLFAKYTDEVQAGRTSDQTMREAHDLRRQALRAADAGADVHHGLPQGRLRQARPQAARRPSPRCATPPRRSRTPGEMKYPIALPLAGQRATSSPPTTPRWARWAPTSSTRTPRSRNFDKPEADAGARGAEVAAALHGPAGRPPSTSRRSSSRCTTARAAIVDHVLRADERPDAGRRTASSPSSSRSPPPPVGRRWRRALQHACRSTAGRSRPTPRSTRTCCSR